MRYFAAVKRPDIIFWLQWIGANTLAWTVGWLVTGAVIGVFAGIAQWLVLYRRVAWARWWAFASFIGWLAGLMLGPGVSSGINVLLSLAGSEARVTYAPAGWAVFGTAMGTAQWYLLRWHVHRAGWWVLVSSVAWTCGFAVAVPLSEVIGRVTGSALAGMIVGTISGVPMIWLLRNPIPGR